MSTMVPMPVRVKPPPAEIGEIISPGCADLAMTTPAERGADDGVVELHLRDRQRLLRDLDLLLDVGEPGPQHVPLGERGVQALRAHQLPVEEPLLADVVALGLIELGAYLGELRARGHELGLRQAEPGAGLGVVETRQHRALVAPACPPRSAPR